MHTLQCTIPRVWERDCNVVIYQPLSLILNLHTCVPDKETKFKTKIYCYTINNRFTPNFTNAPDLQVKYLKCFQTPVCYQSLVYVWLHNLTAKSSLIQSGSETKVLTAVLYLRKFLCCSRFCSPLGTPWLLLGDGGWGSPELETRCIAQWWIPLLTSVVLVN